MILLSLSIDINRSLSEVNRQPTRLEELSSQKALGIIQRDHFNGPSVIEPENFRFMNVSMDNPSVRQNIRFPADSLETHAPYYPRRKAQLSGETCVDDNWNLALLRGGVQNNNGFPRSGYCSFDGHVLRSE
jgi:hypothetical protein